MDDFDGVCPLSRKRAGERGIGQTLRLNLRMCVHRRLEFGITLGDFTIVVGQLFARREHVERQRGFTLSRRNPGQAVQRQAQAHRRIARQQIEAAAAEGPDAALPTIGKTVPGDRQHVADRLIQPARQLGGQTAPLHRVFQIDLGRVQVVRHFRFLQQVMQRIFVAILRKCWRQAQFRRQFGAEFRRHRRGVAVRLAFIGQQRRVLPQREAVGAPENAQRPARQRLAGIPLALAGELQAVRREMPGQPVPQVLRPFQFVLAQGGGVPLRRFHVVDRHESRLAAHGQAHVVFGQPGVHGAAERVDGGPLIVAVGLGHARVFVDAHDAVVEAEADLALVHRAGHRCCAGRVRRTGERNMVFAGEQAGGGIEAEPAGARHINLGPGVQIGEVGFRAGWAVERFQVGGELHQIAGHEARGKSEVAQHLHQQPGAVAAGTTGLLQRFLAGLHAGFHADVVFERLPDALIEFDQKVLRASLAAVHVFQPGHQQRPGFDQLAIRHQFLGQLRVVFEWILGGVFLQEEIERIDHGHVRDHLHLEVEARGLLREHQARQIVAERILLPVDEMLLRQDAQRIAQDRRAAVRGGAQTQNVRAEVDRPVITVMGLVADSDANAHGGVFL